MKKFVFVLLGLFTAAMSLTAVVHSTGHQGDWFDLLIAAVFAYWAYASFRKAGRLAPAPAQDKPRPWNR